MNKFKKLLILPILLGLVACGGNNGNSSSSSVVSTPSISMPAPSVSTPTPSIPVVEEWTVYFMYNYDGNTNEFSHSYIKDGEKAAAPYQRPTREGYRFSNWYKDAACTELFDFANEVITAETYIYAGWIEIQDPSKGFDITWTRTSGILYQSVNDEQLPTHVDVYVSVSFTITVLATHEGAPIVRANGTQLLPVDGVYTIKSISSRTTVTVTGISLKEVIDPSESVIVPDAFYLTLNGEIIGEMTNNNTTMEGVIAEYVISHEFAENDVVTIVDKDGREYKNWENGGEFVANAPVIVTTPGEYTFYLKVYESRISIWIEKPLDPSFEYITVYFSNPNNWSTVYCYAWVGAGDAYMGQWPGKQMEKDPSTGYYYMDNIVKGENIIFNNGSGSQTADLKVPTNGANLFNGNSWTNLDGSITPDNPGTNPNPTPSEPTGEYYKIYFTLPEGWDPVAKNPRIHYWGSENTEALGLFTLGAQSNMTLESGNTYYIEIDTSVIIDGMIIIIDQGTEVKQSYDVTTGLPTVAGEYEIIVDWGHWEPNSYDVWCFFAEIYSK